MFHIKSFPTFSTDTSNLKLKSLQNGFQLIIQCHSIIKTIAEREPDDVKEDAKKENVKEMLNDYKLLSLLENRLNYLIKSIIQYCRSKSNKDYEKMTEMYKKLYSVSLRIKKSDNIKNYATSICDILEEMEVIIKEYE